MVMQHFHLPQQQMVKPLIPLRMTSRSTRNYRGNNQFNDDPIPTIKCSLCSTPHRKCQRKLAFESFDGSFESSNGLFDSIGTLDMSPIQASTEPNFLINAKRFIVKIFTINNDTNVSTN